jgi:hypothetical protein
MRAGAWTIAGVTLASAVLVESVAGDQRKDAHPESQGSQAQAPWSANASGNNSTATSAAMIQTGALRNLLTEAVTVAWVRDGAVQMSRELALRGSLYRVAAGSSQKMYVFALPSTSST